MLDSLPFSMDLVFCVLVGFALLNIFLSMFKIRAFLSETPAIRVWDDLERFKRLARGNMYLALLQIGLIGSAAVIGIFSNVDNRIFYPSLLGLILIGMVVNRGEKKTRTLPVELAEAEAEYRRIGEVWVKKALPDF